MPSRKKKSAEYRRCDCGESWKTRDALLRDKNVKIIGYQPDFVNHKYNHFLFQHKAKGCGAFFGVRASDFKDLREKECPNDLCFGHDECPGYCMDTSDLRVCSVTCRNASDRLGRGGAAGRTSAPAVDTNCRASVTSSPCGFT